MRCGRAEDLITEAGWGPLSVRDQQALDEHLASCAACRRARETTVTLMQALAAAPAEAPVSARLEQETLRRVRQAAADEVERRERGVWPRWLGFSMPVAAVAVVVLAVLLARQEPSGPLPAVPSGAPPAVAKRAAEAPVRVARPAAPSRAVETADASGRVRQTVPDEPPPELAQRPDLFIELPLLRNMEKLEHYESIGSVTPGEEQPAG